MATGCLSSPNLPKFAGLETLRGPDLSHRHTGRTRASISPASASAIIGTGSSAMQSIPIIASQAKHLTVFQRTPNYAVPAHNAPLDPAYVQRGQGRLRRPCARAPRQTMTGIDFDYSDATALETPPEERAARVRGALAARRAVLPRRLHRPAGRRGGQRHRRRVRARQDPRDGARSRRSPSCCRRRTSSAASGCASTPATTRPSIGRNVTLVDVSDDADRGASPATACSASGARLRGRRHRVRHRLRCHDRRARSRSTSAAAAA